MLLVIIKLQSSRFVFSYWSIKKLLSLSSSLTLIPVHFGLNVLIKKLLLKKNVSDPLVNRALMHLAAVHIRLVKTAAFHSENESNV